MTNVVNLSDFRRRPPLVWDDVVARVVDDICIEWERMARNNRLNEYFKSNAPSFMVDGVNYMSDLNGLSSLEYKINHSPTIHPPQSLGRDQIGWIVSFRVEDNQAHTIELASEPYARAFAIIMFLKLKRALLQSRD